MTKKHYKMIAGIIRRAEKAGELKYAGSVMYRFVACLKKDNPKFNQEKFIDECDIYEN